jgi:hypothetical protein
MKEEGGKFLRDAPLKINDALIDSPLIVKYTKIANNKTHNDFSCITN